MDCQGKLIRFLLNEVNIEMREESTLWVQIKEGIDSAPGSSFEPTSGDLKTIESWNLSHNQMTDCTFSYITGLLRDVVSSSMKFIDLSYNRLSTKALNDLIHILRHNFPNAEVDMSYNSMEKHDLDKLPDYIKQRVKMRCEWDISIDLDKFAKSLEKVQQWQKYEEKALEGELTKAVVAHYQGFYQQVRILPLSQILNKKGEVVAQFDGLVTAKSAGKPSILATIESKHTLREKDIHSRLLRIQVLQDFLSNLPDTDDNDYDDVNFSIQMWKKVRDYKLEHFIGGVFVPDSVMTNARREGYHVIQARGSRYFVSLPTK